MEFFYTLTALEQWLVWLSATFVGLSLLTLLVLVLSRVVKTFAQLWRVRLSQRYQEDLNAIVMNQLSPPSAAEFHLGRLRKTMGSTRYAQQVLIEQIQGLHKNLLGSTATVLSETYKRLDLPKASLRNVRSWRWERKAKAIIE